MDRRDYLIYLRGGAQNDNAPIPTLSHLANTYGDQTVQKAAMTGLSKHLSPESTLALAKRLLDPWGMGALTHAIRTLAKLRQVGGLIPLGASLFYDERFVPEKFQSILTCLDAEEDLSVVRGAFNYYNEGHLFVEPRCVNKIQTMLLNAKDNDLRSGLLFGSQFESRIGVLGSLLESAEPEMITEARVFIQIRLPGFVELYDERVDAEK